MSMIDVSATEQKIAARVDNGIAGGLEVSNAVGGLGFANMSQAMEFAKLMCVSSVAVPKHLRGNPGACLAVVIQAIEWKLSPYAVANKSYSVNDRLAYESQLIQAVILQRAPIDGRFKVEYKGTGDARVCRVWAKLRDSNETVDYESPPFGKITPKNSPLWKSDPDQQQFYYSGRALCRRHFPDVLLGVYADDEITPDPERARDVTPSRTISDKLDALAQAPSNGATTDDANGAQETASSGGEATAESAGSAGASPAARGHTAEENAAVRSTASHSPSETSGQASTADQAAPDAQPAADTATASGAAARRGSDALAAEAENTIAVSGEWPADRVPANADEYAAYATAWIGQIRAGALSPDEAKARWKSELKLRNACGLDEERRDPLKAALDAALAEVKRAA